MELSRTRRPHFRCQPETFTAHHSGGGIGGWGTVFELVTSNGGWTQNVLYRLHWRERRRQTSFAGVIFDNIGNLYGTTYEGGQLSCGGP